MDGDYKKYFVALEMPLLQLAKFTNYGSIYEKHYE